MNSHPHIRLLLVSATFYAVAPIAWAQDAKPAPKADIKPGNWLQVPADGTPWKHFETGIAYPQKLGGFTLHSVFRDKRDEAGIALTYLLPSSNIKADIVLFPCKEKQVSPINVIKIVRGEHVRLIDDIVATAARQGYAERSRSSLVENAIELFDKGLLPLTTFTLDLVAANGDTKARPPINQWLGLSLYADYFIQMSVLMPAQKDAKAEDFEKARKQVDELITLLIQCIKEPAVVPEMLKLCKKYVDHPLDDEGRGAADALLLYSKESPIFEVALPGEAITPALDEIGARSQEASVDLLRAFVVGSSVVALQGGTVDQSLAEGTRLLLLVRDLLRKKAAAVDSPLLDELAAAAKQGKAAEFIRSRMVARPAK